MFSRPALLVGIVIALTAGKRFKIGGKPPAVMRAVMLSEDVVVGDLTVNVNDFVTALQATEG